MLVTVICQTTHKARKAFVCGLAEHAGEVHWPRGMAFSELRSLVTYQRNKRRVVPGDTYVRQFNEYEGDTYVWKARKDIFEIFCKYGLLREY